MYSATDEFFDLTNATKLSYQFGDDNHGWVATEQERSARNVINSLLFTLLPQALI